MNGRLLLKIKSASRGCSLKPNQEPSIRLPGLPLTRSMSAWLPVLLYFWLGVVIKSAVVGTIPFWKRKLYWGLFNHPCLTAMALTMPKYSTSRGLIYSGELKLSGVVPSVVYRIVTPGIWCLSSIISSLPNREFSFWALELSTLIFHWYRPGSRYGYRGWWAWLCVYLLRLSVYSK